MQRAASPTPKPFGEIWVAHADGKVAAAAVVARRPRAYPRGLRRERS